MALVIRMSQLVSTMEVVLESHFRVHDSVLIGIVVKDFGVRLIISQDGGPFYVDLVNVSVFKADNFLIGNVILDVVTKNIGQMQKHELEGLLESLMEDGIVNDVVLAQYISEGKTYFELNPSYGCEIISVCDAVEYKKVT
jgi:hypothetical protein